MTVQNDAAERAAVAAQDVAPHHDADQAAIAPDGQHRIDEGAADGAQRALARAALARVATRTRSSATRAVLASRVSTSRNGQPCS